MPRRSTRGRSRRCSCSPRRCSRHSSRSRTPTCNTGLRHRLRMARRPRRSCLGRRKCRDDTPPRRSKSHPHLRTHRRSARSDPPHRPAAGRQRHRRSLCRAHRPRSRCPPHRTQYRLPSRPSPARVQPRLPAPNRCPSPPRWTRRTPSPSRSAETPPARVLARWGGLSWWWGYSTHHLASILRSISRPGAMRYARRA
jgi:hypothetical protein